VSQGTFEVLTLGTLAVIVVFGVIGYAAGAGVRSNVVDVPLETEAATVPA
jgi:energy-converting hydrogenase Eha subunit E